MSERKTTRFAVLEAERVVKVHEREIPALKADEVLYDRLWAVYRSKKKSDVSYGMGT